MFFVESIFPYHLKLETASASVIYKQSFSNSIIIIPLIISLTLMVIDQLQISYM